MKTITMQILDGNLLNNRAPTRKEVDRLVEMTREALEKEFPGADVLIDLQRDTSGATRPLTVEDDEGCDHGARDEERAHEITQRAWQEWVEGLDEKGCGHRDGDGRASASDLNNHAAGDECPHCGCTLGSDGYWYVDRDQAPLGD